MVEWLLQNSLGLTWLAMCKSRGWTADAERVLPELDARRADWRAKRDAGEVPLDALMPTQGTLEEHWKYYVPQAIPDDAVAKAPASVRALKILDPACGSGHFLVIAFDLLAALYREEARHLGQEISDQQVAEAILEDNLYGIDIDPRATQIAAAGLYLKAKTLSKAARPKRLNLVAPVLQLGNLPADDPAVTALRRELKQEAGIPEELTTKLLSSLAGVDYLGSLLKVDAAIDEAIKDVELTFVDERGQGNLFNGFPSKEVQVSAEDAKATIVGKLEGFLAKHSKSEDLGLRLDGEQLAAGVRFVRIAKEDTYDVVVGNPPYHGTGKLLESSYVVTEYPAGKADLFACFYMRGLELVRRGGLVSLITLSNWTTLGVFRAFRGFVRRNSLVALAELGKAAFTTGGTLISTTCAVIRRATDSNRALALRPHAPQEVVRDDGQAKRTEAALRIQRGRYDFQPSAFEVIEGEPIVYWWSEEFLAKYAAAPKLGEQARVKQGVSTADNARFIRNPWELRNAGLASFREDSDPNSSWVPHVKGGPGRSWIEPLTDVLNWAHGGLELQLFEGSVVRNPDYFFRKGVAFSMIGSSFAARLHRFCSICNQKASSVFLAPATSVSLSELVCAMNSTTGRYQLQSLNPGIGFEVGDVVRLGLFPSQDSERVVEVLETAFEAHESAREPSIEFRGPGPSTWGHAQQWAQQAVDRPQGAGLPEYEPYQEVVPPETFVSFSLGLSLGRFSASGDEILRVAPAEALPNGILFLATSEQDSLNHAACSQLHGSWAEHGATIAPGEDLRTYLRKSFFDYHKKLYENRPIYFPLSSAKKSFVAFISIHRWAEDTLNVLLADHLVPTRRRLEGELDDLRTARSAGTAGTSKNKLEKRFTDVQKLLEELTEFIGKVTEIAEKGPPPPDTSTEKRHADARYVMDLDDGVMVNSAALWPLLEPQWKDPKKWWKELANAKGKKDYDWSHLAARYFPERVKQKCHVDPSLAVAHKCFWELHPAKAYAWELRLQDEIRADFTIDEPGSNEARARFLKEHAREAAELLAKEQKRREKKNAKADEEGDAGPLFDGADSADDEEATDE
jgi:hypothetical protein